VVCCSSVARSTNCYVVTIGKIIRGSRRLDRVIDLIRRLIKGETAVASVEGKDEKRFDSMAEIDVDNPSTRQ
jgi:hypothetical protein